MCACAVGAMIAVALLAASAGASAQPLNLLATNAWINAIAASAGH